MMKNNSIIFIICIIIVIVLTSIISSSLFNNFKSFDNELQPNEVINGSYMIFASENEFSLIPSTLSLNGSGAYHIKASTTQRGQIFLIGFTYKTQESDRFGKREGLTEYGWVFPPVRTNYGYLGGTDDYSILTADFTIPKEAVSSEIKILSTTGGHVNITITKSSELAIKLKEAFK